MNIEELREMWSVNIRDDIFDNKDSSAWRDSLMHGLQDLHALLIVPIMQNQLLQVGIRNRNIGKHIAAHILASILQAQFLSPQR
jgi:hypothetical protein